MQNVCSDFFLQLSSETFLILRRIQQGILKIHTFSCKVLIMLVIFLWHLNFLNRFSKFLKIKFHENPANGSQVAPCG